MQQFFSEVIMIDLIKNCSEWKDFEKWPIFYWKLTQSKPIINMHELPDDKIDSIKDLSGNTHLYAVSKSSLYREANSTYSSEAGYNILNVFLSELQSRKRNSPAGSVVGLGHSRALQYLDLNPGMDES